MKCLAGRQTRQASGLRSQCRCLQVAMLTIPPLSAQLPVADEHQL
jgi:hypothetical protein